MIEFSPADRLTAAAQRGAKQILGSELCYVLQLSGGSVLRVTAFGWSCVTCYSFSAP